MEGVLVFIMLSFYLAFLIFSSKCNFKVAAIGTHFEVNCPFFWSSHNFINEPLYVDLDLPEKVKCAFSLDLEYPGIMFLFLII